MMTKIGSCGRGQQLIHPSLSLVWLSVTVKRDVMSVLEHASSLSPKHSGIESVIVWRH